MTRGTPRPETLDFDRNCQTSQDSKAQPSAFLRKTFELVSQPATDTIISWGKQGVSFVVWDTAALAKDELPKYFKHNNFSSFVRQLNTYGFRKADPDQWEFEREHFRRDDFAALSRIFRRKGPSSRDYISLPKPYTTPVLPLQHPQASMFSYQAAPRELLHQCLEVRLQSGLEQNISRKRSSFDESRPSISQGGASTGLMQEIEQAPSERSTERFGMLVDTILEAENIIEPREASRNTGASHPQPLEANVEGGQLAGGTDLDRAGQQHEACQCSCLEARQLTETLIGRVAQQATVMSSLVAEVHLLRQQVHRQAEQIAGFHAVESSAAVTSSPLRKRSKGTDNSAELLDSREEAQLGRSREPSSLDHNSGEDVYQRDDKQHRELDLATKNLHDRKSFRGTSSGGSMPDRLDAQRYKTPLERLRAYLSGGIEESGDCASYQLIQANSIQAWDLSRSHM